MRIIFGLIGLIVVLAIVATLAKKQLSAVSEIKVPQAAGIVLPAVDPNASVQQQSQQIQQQIKQSVDTSLQQTRPMPDEK
jgi:hypothetical protein